DNYCVSAEHSLRIHAGNHSVPHQLIVRAVNGTNSVTEFPFGTSLFIMKSAMAQNGEIVEENGLRLLSLESALVNCSSTFFLNYPTDARTALAMVADASEILRILLDGGRSSVAGRLASAFRNIGREKLADDIVKTMEKAGYVIRE